MVKKNQSSRLTEQHKKSQGAVGIFDEEAQVHDMAVNKISMLVSDRLKSEYPSLQFRYRKSVDKKEINAALKKIDPYLGQTLFRERAIFAVPRASSSSSNQTSLLPIRRFPYSGNMCRSS